MFLYCMNIITKERYLFTYLFKKIFFYCRIEHLYPDALIELPFNIFGYIKPEVAIITTPNVEFNVVFPYLSGFRHIDHKFEWTRKQFQDW